MADLKISALPASSTPLAGTEVLPIVQSATTRQVSVANLTAGRAVSALSLTSTNDATLSGLTVGRGGGADATNTAVGANALAATSTGGANVAVGASALASNLGGTGNTASGLSSLRDNTSGNYNVASGYLALATNLSGANNVGIGYSVLSTATATSNNTAIGYEALKVASGGTNTAIGYQSGVAMTTGTNNVILGSYSGNNGTLDIRGTNYNLVLSDGAGNVRAWWDNANARFYGTLLATGITNSALTSGRVTYAGASGLLTDSANLQFDGTTLTAATGAAFATTSGNVNIGTSSIGGKVSILQGTAATPALTTDVTNAVGSIWHRYTTASGVNQYMDIILRSGTEIEYNTNSKDISLINNSTFLVKSSGSVGIGTASSASFTTFSPKLVVGSGSGNQAITIYTGTTSVGDIIFANGTTGTDQYKGILRYDHSDNAMKFYTNGGTLGMTQNSVGGVQVLNTVGVGNTAPSTSGAGITFPAVQSPSSDPNTLDDYEKGTWNPVITSGTGSITTYSASGTYVKVGNLIYLKCRASIVNAGTAGGALNAGSIPFPSGPTIISYGTGSEIASTGTYYATYLVPNGTSVTLTALPSGPILWVSGYIYDFYMIYTQF